MNNIHIKNTTEEIIEKLSERIKSIIDARASKGEIYIAISGGSTPKALFNHLSQNYKENIPWKKIHLFWVDERCVPPENSDSNYGMTYNALIKSVPIPEKNIHRMIGEEEPETEAKRYACKLNSFLNKVNNAPEFDIILLGLGDDGHTASIFPNQIDLYQSNELCEVGIHPQTGQKRITLTGKVINNAQYILFLVTGKRKANVVGDILNKSGNFKNHPASLVYPENGQLEWFLDKDAAEKIANTRL